MNRIKFILIATIALLYSSHILVAQSHTDTNYIDTNYYRYTYTPLCDFILCKHRNVTFFAMDYIYDTCVNMCPKDGFGLTEYDTIHGIVANPIDCPWVGTAVIPEFQYHMLKLPDGGTDVYGVAVFISSLRNFSPGSYIRFFACRKADDGSHFEKIDSVDLTTNTIGVRRFMRYPILKNEARNVLYHPHLVEPFEECNDRIFDAQVLELYFDQPFHIADSQIFFKIEQHIPRGYFIYSLRTNKHISKTYFYDSNCNLSSTRYYLDIIMAITEPLPEWEHDKLEVLLQNDTEQPDPDPEEPTRPTPMRWRSRSAPR